MHSIRPVTALLLLTFITAVTGCSPVKGYPGPDLPDSLVSNIEYSNDSQAIAVNTASIDGVSFGGWGINVLPGKHDFYLGVTVKAPPDHCYTYPNMNHYGYGECLRKNGDSRCDCFDYLEIRRKCFRQVRDGSCKGGLTTRAGAKYSITPSGFQDAAHVIIYEAGTRNSNSSGRCEVGSQRTAEEDDYVGTGRYTANSNGIYYCY